MLDSQARTAGTLLVALQYQTLKCYVDLAASTFTYLQVQPVVLHCLMTGHENLSSLQKLTHPSQVLLTLEQHPVVEQAHFPDAHEDQTHQAVLTLLCQHAH